MEVFTKNIGRLFLSLLIIVLVSCSNKKVKNNTFESDYFKFEFNTLLFAKFDSNKTKSGLFGIDFGAEACVLDSSFSKKIVKTIRKYEITAFEKIVPTYICLDTLKFSSNNLDFQTNIT